MNLTKMSMMNDKLLDDYLEAYRDTLPKPTPNYDCIWNNKKHIGGSPTTWQRFKSHSVSCKYREDHIVIVNKKDNEMVYPIFDPENENDYRGALSLMDMCYEFHAERLEPGWEHYDNRLKNLMSKFFRVYCNMGIAGYQQSVISSYHAHSEINWKVKKSADAPIIGLTNSQMFRFFVNEFKPLLEINLQYVTDTSSYNFWYFMIKGKRTHADKSYRDEVKRAKEMPMKTKIVGPYYIGPKGEVIFN